MPLLAYKNYYPELGEEAYVAPGAYVIGNVKVGARTSIWFGASVRGDMEQITIGEESNIQDNVTIHIDYDTPTIIGNRVTVGHNVVLHSCIVEDGALIGMGSVILNGAVIGKDSLVAAGSLVTPNTKIPPRSMVMGSPGKVVRTLSEDNIPVKDKMYLNYLNLIRNYSAADSG